MRTRLNFCFPRSRGISIGYQMCCITKQFTNYNFSLIRSPSSAPKLLFTLQIKLKESWSRKHHWRTLFVERTSSRSIAQKRDLYFLLGVLGEKQGWKSIKQKKSFPLLLLLQILAKTRLEIFRTIFFAKKKYLWAFFNHLKIFHSRR